MCIRAESLAHSAIQQARAKGKVERAELWHAAAPTSHQSFLRIVVYGTVMRGGPRTRSLQLSKVASSGDPKGHADPIAAHTTSCPSGLQHVAGL